MVGSGGGLKKCKKFQINNKSFKSRQRVSVYIHQHIPAYFKAKSFVNPWRSTPLEINLAHSKWPIAHLSYDPHTKYCQRNKLHRFIPVQ